MRADDREVDCGADQHADERRERARDGDLELLARSARLPAHLGESAEQEQLDPLDLDSLRARRQRVAHLMDDQRAEEQQYGRDSRQIGDAVGGVQGVAERP